MMIKLGELNIWMPTTLKQTKWYVGQYFVIYNYTFIQGGGYLSENSLPGKSIFNCTALMHEQYNEEYYSSDLLHLHSLSQQICLQYQNNISGNNYHFSLIFLTQLNLAGR